MLKMKLENLFLHFLEVRSIKVNKSKQFVSVCTSRDVYTNVGIYVPDPICQCNVLT